jgi:hypothetical protein
MYLEFLIACSAMKQRLGLMELSRLLHAAYKVLRLNILDTPYILRESLKCFRETFFRLKNNLTLILKDN